MTNYNVFNSAIIAALFAFSSQISEISNSFEKPMVVTKKIAVV